jgi:hypothetical protein
MLLPARVCCAALLLLVAGPGLCAQSQWVHPGSDGRLAYAQSPRGDRIPDFSSAGYRGGGVALPSVPVKATIAPGGGADDTAAIQAALDKVAQMPLDAHGARGTVLLAAGTYRLAGVLHMTASGVVLRGDGSTGANATVLTLTGAPHLAIEMRGDFAKQALGDATTMTDSYVAAGATVIHLADASGVKSDDWLEIVKPVTPAWVAFMGMDHLSRDGKPETWVENDIRVLRQVHTVAGHVVTLEVPLTDSFDAQYFGGGRAPVTRVEVSGLIAEAGVESLRIEAPNRAIAYQKDAEFDGITLDSAEDSWLRDLDFENTTNSVEIGQHALRVTAEGVAVHQRSAVTTSAKPFDFSVQGAQILLDRCRASGNSVWYVATQSHSEGPVVVLHSQFRGDGAVEPHQRWSTGLLVDTCTVENAIHLMNRGEMGSGHGWTIGWSVLWNNEAGEIVVQNPPGVLNWSIGDKGRQESAPMPVFGQPKGPPLPGGVVESAGKHVEPASLYLEQLRERLGPEAVAAIGEP